MGKAPGQMNAGNTKAAVTELEVTICENTDPGYMVLKVILKKEKVGAPGWLRRLGLCLRLRSQAELQPLRCL